MGLMAMAATFWATALLMAAVCCWASFLLSMLMTLKPYFAAFFWYIFQEKAWDGFVIVAMNARVGLSPPAAADGAPDTAAALEPAEAGADVSDLDLDVRVGGPGAGGETRLVLVEQRAPVRADEADVARLRRQRGGRADQEGPLLFVELDASHLRAVHGAVIDDAEPGSRILGGDLGHCARIGGADGEDREVVGVGELPEMLLPVGIGVIRPGGDLLELGAERVSCPLHALPRELVEARTSAPRDVVDDRHARDRA